MENLIAIAATLGLIFLIFKGYKMFFSRRKRESGMRKFIRRAKFVSIFFLCGMIWGPTTLLFCVKNPDKAVIYAGKMWISSERVKKDTRNAFRKANKALNRSLSRYTPTPAKKVLKTASRAYTRYGVRDTQRFTAEAGQELGVKFYKPRASMWERFGNGIKGVGKLLMFWRV